MFRNVFISWGTDLKWMNCQDKMKYIKEMLFWNYDYSIIVELTNANIDYSTNKTLEIGWFHATMANIQAFAVSELNDTSK